MNTPGRPDDTRADFWRNSRHSGKYRALVQREAVELDALGPLGLRSKIVTRMGHDLGHGSAGIEPGPEGKRPATPATVATTANFRTNTIRAGKNNATN
jgi:hypothetical protein